jgi:hypothetical protein
MQEVHVHGAVPFMCTRAPAWSVMTTCRVRASRGWCCMFTCGVGLPGLLTAWHIATTQLTAPHAAARPRPRPSSSSSNSASPLPYRCVAGIASLN